MAILQAPSRIDLLPRQACIIPHRHLDFVVYGGAAGCGKTYAMSAIPTLEAVRADEYSGLFLRRTLAAAKNNKSLWDTLVTVTRRAGGRAKHGARPHVDMPRQGRFQLGHLAKPDSIEDYMGAAYNFIGIDEATEVRCNEMTRLHSRLRDSRGGQPSWMLLSCNPDRLSYLFNWLRPWVDPDHPLYPHPFGSPLWMTIIDDLTGECRHAPEPVKDAHTLTLIPGRVQNNPYMVESGYADSLRKLPPLERARLYHGDWLVSRKQGDVFDTRLIRSARSAEPPIMWNRWTDDVRAWDGAAREKRVKDADYCAGARMRWDGEELAITDMIRKHLITGQLKPLIVSTAKADGPGVRVILEREGGSHSGELISEVRAALPGYVVQDYKPLTDKIARSQALAILVAEGMVTMIEGHWNGECRAEMDAFKTDGVHDDQVDALNLGLHAIRKGNAYAGNRRWIT